jgi:hypothetical protein
MSPSTSVACALWVGILGEHPAAVPVRSYVEDAASLDLCGVMQQSDDEEQRRSRSSTADPARSALRPMVVAPFAIGGLDTNMPTTSRGCRKTKSAFTQASL